MKKTEFLKMLEDPEIDAAMRQRYGANPPITANASLLAPSYSATLTGDEKVTVICMEKCGPGICVAVKYGPRGEKIRKWRSYGEKVDMSVREFEQELAPSPVGKILLDKRIIVVGDNCPKEIRDRLKLNYEDGEFLSPDQVEDLLNLPIDTICDIFENLCLNQKEMIAKIFMAEFYDGGHRATRERVGRLNKLSKKYVEPGHEGMFAAILQWIDDAEAASKGADY